MSTVISLGIRNTDRVNSVAVNPARIAGRTDSPCGTQRFVCEGWKLWDSAHQSLRPTIPLRARPLSWGGANPQGVSV